MTINSNGPEKRPSEPGKTPSAEPEKTPSAEPEKQPSARGSEKQNSARRPKRSSALTATSVGPAQPAGSTYAVPIRVIEIAFVLIAGVIVVVWAMFDLPPAQIDVGGVPAVDLEVLEAGAVGATVVMWLAVLAMFVITEKGRAFVAGSASERMIEDNIATRADSLTIAGLVFAGLTLAPSGGLTGPSGAYLSGALAAFVVAWGAGFFPDRHSSTLVRDAMHWAGLAALLGGVFHLALHLDQDGAGSVAVLLASVLIAAYSAIHARAYLRHVRSPRPKE